MSKIVNFKDHVIFKEVTKAIQNIRTIIAEAEPYADDPKVASFIEEANIKIAELVAETLALEKDMQELKELQEQQV